MAKNVKPGMLRGNTNENKLTADKNDYTLTIIGGMSYGLNDLAQLVVKDGVTTSRVDQLVDNFRIMFAKAIEMGLMGNNINMEYIMMRFGVKGIFNSANEPFIRPKHEVTAIITPGLDMQEAMKLTSVTNMGPSQHYAQMDSIVNTVNGEVNLSLTAGQVVEIKGVNLSILGDAPSVGIYLQEEGAADSTRIKVATLLNNEPKRLMFMVPTTVVKDKSYQIVHISQAGASKSKSGTLLKEPRIEYSIPLKATDGTLIDPDEGDHPVIE